MPAKRVCRIPNCPVVSDKTLCPLHAREAELQRGTFHQRGYDWTHRRDGKKAKQRAVEQQLSCPRCGQPILPGQPLQYGHTLDRALHPGARADRVEHQTCNASAGGKLGASLRGR